MKALFLAFSLLLTTNAFAASDLNQLLSNVCSGVTQQHLSGVTYELCMDGRFSTEGSFGSGYWWGKVIFSDPNGGASYICGFDVSTDHKLRTYTCERRISQGG